MEEAEPNLGFSGTDTKLKKPLDEISSYHSKCDKHAIEILIDNLMYLDTMGIHSA